jgi:GNAT superfamily N-acetyltransferase
VRIEAGGLRIRDYAPTDRTFLADGLEEILKEKAKTAAEQEIDPAPGWGNSYASFLLKSARKSGGIGLVATVEGTRAGFAFGAPDIGVPTWMRKSARFSRRCQILEVHVATDFRKMPIGRLLIRELERRFTLRGYDWMVASYHRGHRFEEGLYCRCGFTVNSVGVAKWLTKAPSRRNRHTARR